MENKTKSPEEEFSDLFSKIVKLSRLYQFFSRNYEQIRGYYELSLRQEHRRRRQGEFRRNLIEVLRKEEALKRYIKGPFKRKRLARSVMELFSYESEEGDRKKDIGMLIGAYNRVILTNLLDRENSPEPFYWHIGWKYGVELEKIRKTAEERLHRMPGNRRRYEGKGMYITFEDNKIGLTERGEYLARVVMDIWESTR